MLKTGIRDGPSKGKSFYICGAMHGQCRFTQLATIPVSHCILHEGSVVELQTLLKQPDKEQYRLYFRCAKGKTDGMKWCGIVPWQDQKSKKSPSEQNSCEVLEKSQKPKTERNPFRILSENQNTSVWKAINEKVMKETVREKEQPVEQQISQTESWRDKPLPAGIKIKSSSERMQKVFGKNEKSSEAETKDLLNLNDEKNSLGKLDCQNPKDTKHSKVEATIIQDAENLKKASQDVEKNTKEKHLKEQVPVKKITAEQQPVKKEIGESLGDKHFKEKRGTGEQKYRQADSIECNRVAVKEKNETIKNIKEETQKHKETKLAKDLKSSVDPPTNSTTSSEQATAEGTSAREKDIGSGGGDEGIVVTSIKPGQSKSIKQIEAPGRSSAVTGQRTITSFPGFASSSQVAEPQDPLALHSQLSAQLKQKKATLAAVNISALPDKGQRLIDQVTELEDALGSLCLSAAESSNQDSNEKPKSQETTSFSQFNPFSRTTTEQKGTIQLARPPPYQDSQSGSSLGLQFHSVPSHVRSSQYYGHIYGVNPQRQNLYGGRMTEDRLLAVRNVTTEAIDHLHKSLETCPTAETACDDPPGLKVHLLPHQKQALEWLLWREMQKPPGGILADDMGLGKTLTMIALILAQKQKESTKEDMKLEKWISKNDSSLVISHGTLIICPASLVHHWKKEIERHVRGSNLRVYLYHGPNRERNPHILSKYDVVVTTYSLIGKEIPTKEEECDGPVKDEEEEIKPSSAPPLLLVTWARIILDEAHNIKNPKVQTSMAVCKLRAGKRWAVTGTPIQNNLLDMYSLLRFLHCSPFDEFKLWKTQVDNGTKKGGERLSILTKTLLLRRMKDQLDATGKPLVPLPQRHSQAHRLTLSEDEQSVYNVLFARSRSALQSYLKRHEGKDDNNRKQPDNPFDRVAHEFGVKENEHPSARRTTSEASSTVHILSLLLRLRQCCCHLSLLKMTLEHVELENEGITLSLEEQLSALTLSEVTTPDTKATVSLNGTNFQADIFENTKESTKISSLLVQLEAIRSSPGQQKSVIVSQWTSMLNVVAIHLKKIGLAYATIDGSVNPKKRMDLVEEFNMNPKGPQVMLVSLCAGGVGLNLIGGNHLFLLDMHWNPALEDQACDRIYRVGQSKNVTIHRFVCEETVEEKICKLQEKKKELAKKVLSGTGDAVTKLSLADLKILFGV